MTHLIPNILTLHPMHSGHLCLELSDIIRWDQFDEFAEEFSSKVGGSVYQKVDGVEMRIWHLQLPTCQVRLVYEDFPPMVSLESDTHQGDELMRNLAEKLKKEY